MKPTENTAAAKMRAVALMLLDKVPEMTLGQMETFFTVAVHQGRSIRELCELTGTQQQTMSRRLRDLGAQRRNRIDGNDGKEEGAGLVEARASDNDMRERRYSLSPRGLQLLAVIEQLLATGARKKAA